MLSTSLRYLVKQPCKFQCQLMQIHHELSSIKRSNGLRVEMLNGKVGKSIHVFIILYIRRGKWQTRENILYLLKCSE